VDLVAPKETAAMMSGRLLVKYIKRPSRRRYVVTSDGWRLFFLFVVCRSGPVWMRAVF
jgi:hypothetical protein